MKLCEWCGRQPATDIIKHALFEPRQSIGVCASCRAHLNMDGDSHADTAARAEAERAKAEVEGVRHMASREILDAAEEYTRLLAERDAELARVREALANRPREQAEVAYEAGIAAMREQTRGMVDTRTLHSTNAFAVVGNWLRAEADALDQRTEETGAGTATEKGNHAPHVAALVDLLRCADEFSEKDNHADDQHRRCLCRWCNLRRARTSARRVLAQHAPAPGAERGENDG